MIVVTTLLQALTQAEVTEVCLASNQRPAARRGQRLEEIGAEAVTSDDLVQVLFSTGGSRYVDTLGARAAQWRTRVDGVGVVVVNASMTGDVIEVRFALKDAPAAVAPRAPRPRSNRPARGNEATRSPRPVSRGRSDPDEAPATPRFSEDDGERPSRIPTPPRGFKVPREAMRSLLELDLDADLPPLPELDSSDFDSVPPSDDGTFPGAPGAFPQAPAAPRAPPPLPPRARTPQPMPAVRPPPPQAATAITVPPPKEAEPTPEALARQTLPESAFQSLPPGAPSAEPKARSTGRTTRPFARDPHTPLLRRLLQEAQEAHASDVHLAARRPPLMRVVGQLIPHGDPIDPAVMEDMWISRLPKRLEPTFERDGSCDFALEDPELGRFRVNVSRFRGGVKASLRVIPTYIPSLEFLGLPPVIAQATRHHQGLIVLTGPTGHGKTTTLAAVVDILNTDTTRHVITVEDPIEFIHPRKRALMSQREVGTHTRSFHTALKAALREDPDVIVIGELRDTETVRIALEASETGHLVLGTMSTPSAARAIDRLIDLFPPGDQQQVRMTLAGGLRLIVSQRLLPDTEGKAMVAAAEVLPGVVQLWNLIRDNRTYQIPSFQQRGRELGVVRLDDSLRELVRAGKTTAAHAVAVAEAPDELEASLKPPPLGLGVPPPPGSSPGQVPSSRATSRERPDPKPPDSRGIFDRVFKKGG